MRTFEIEIKRFWQKTSLPQTYRNYSALKVIKLIFVMFALYTDRCSVIEPGPVSTSFVANAQMTESDTHPEEVDDETKQLLNNCIKKMRGAFSTMVQTPDEIAQVILTALDAERPHFRYQTNKNYASSAANKLVDITGDKSMEMMHQRFFS